MQTTFATYVSVLIAIQELNFANMTEAHYTAAKPSRWFMGKPYDLKLLDMSMKDMNDVEIMAAKNAKPELKEVPTIIISATCLRSSKRSENGWRSKRKNPSACC